MAENAISHQIVGIAIEVHRTLGGPGLLESVYEDALVWELCQAGLHVDRQVELPIHYKTTTLRTPLRMDVVVENLVVVECKATAEMNPIFRSQAQTYLKLSRYRLALIINFGMPVIKDGLIRVVNGLPNEPLPPKK